MTNPYATFSDRPLFAIFGPVVWPRTYARLLYLLLGFPLGLAYFVFYVTGFALGLGLLVLGIGLVILALVVLSAWPLALFERAQAIHLLGVDVPSPRRPLADERLRTWLEDVVTNPVTWKGLAFLVAKFPLGLASWIVVIVALSLVGGLLFAPAVVALGGRVELGIWEPASAAEAWWLVPAGLAAFLAMVHLIHGLAWGWGRLARLMLGRSVPAPAGAPRVGLTPASI